MLFDELNQSPLGDRLNRLIAITREAEQAIDQEESDRLMDCLDRRRMELEAVDRLAVDPGQLSAQEMALRARLYVINHRMITKAEALHDKNRLGLRTVRQEKLITGYGVNRPEPIQALDIRE